MHIRKCGHHPPLKYGNAHYIFKNAFVNEKCSISKCKGDIFLILKDYGNLIISRVFKRLINERK